MIDAHMRAIQGKKIRGVEAARAFYPALTAMPGA